MRKWVVLLALLFVCNINAQQVDAQTGNIIYSTVNPAPQGTPVSWSGFVPSNSTGQGFSGGNVPTYNPNTGTFIFGYTMGTVSYSTSINYALASVGSNIRVNGLRYSWEYLNQDTSRGTLTGNINLTSNTGQVLQNYNYNMPQTTNGWTRMTGTETFSTQYAPSNLGNLNVSFTGKDDRWWAGYYGPQIRDFGVNLLYSVATPTIPTDFTRWIKLGNENDSFTLTKAGVVRYGGEGVYDYKSLEPGTYSCSNSAWGKDPIGGVFKACELGSNTTTTTPTVPTAPSTTVTDYTTALLDPVTTTTTPTATPTSSVTTVVEPISSPIATTSTTSSQPSVTAAVVSAPAPTTSSSTSTPSSSSSASSSASSSSATASSSQTTRETSSSGGGNVSLALSIISRNSERDAAGSAVAQSAIAQAQQAANQAQQEASSVASNAVSNSISANIVSTSGQQSNSSSARANNANSSNFSLQSGITSAASVTVGPQTTNNMSQQNTASLTSSQIMTQTNSNTSSGPQQAVTNTSATYQVPLLPPTATVSSVSAPAPSTSTEQAQPTFQNNNTNTVTQGNELYAMVAPNLFTDRSNPINEIVEGRQTLSQSNTTATKGPSVNSNASDNDVAGGISINRMALAPVGYGDYLNFTLRDASFYAPKEVYKNQRNVDNARALRQLTNDSRHREMVEQQYRR